MFIKSSKNKVSNIRVLFCFIYFPNNNYKNRVLACFQTRPEFYKYTRLPVTRWVKVSLNFEFLVPK